MMNPDESAKDSPAGFTNESTADADAAAGPDERAAPPAADWPAIRAVYENERSVTTRVILERFGITKHALQKRVQIEDWARRKRKKARSVSRAGLIRLMLETVDRQMRRAEDESISLDRRVVMLGSLSRTLAKVLQMEAARRRGEARESRKSAEVRSEMTELRKKIASRIEQLNQG